MNVTLRTEQVSRHKYVGERIKRFEDRRVLEGTTTYVDDISLPRMAYMGIIRSPVAHARLKDVSLSSTDKAGTNIISFLSGRDIQSLSRPIPALMSPPGMKRHDVYALAIGKVRYVGEPVAALVCEDRYLAEDAVEFVDIEYEPLQPVVRVERALEEQSSLLYEDWKNNLCYEKRIVSGDVESAFSKADLVVREKFQIQRQHGSTMEPRGVVASYDQISGQLTLWSSTQIPHLLRKLLSESLMIPDDRLRVIAPDVGGGFGNKGGLLYQEEVLACLLATRTGRPIKWIASRREDFISTVHSREQVHHVELAVDKNGIILGLKDRILADIGSFYTSNLGPPILTLVSLPGPYRIASCDLQLYCVVSNKTPIGGYRGYGMPQAFFAIERAIDIASKNLGLDPAEVREKNLLTKDEFPFKTVTNQILDTGDYGSALRMGLKRIGYGRLRERQRRLQGKGAYLGIGISFCIEGTGNDLSIFGASNRYTGENAIVRVDPSGKVKVLTGLSPHGQGSETTLAQLCAEILEIPITDVSIIHGDTAICPHGQGTWGSRNAVVGGMTVMMAANKLKEKSRKIAARMLNVGAEDIQYKEGRFFVKGSPNKLASFQQVAREASSVVGSAQGAEQGLEAKASYSPSTLTYPYAVHIVAVQVNPDSGQTEILRYAVVEDCGRVINPTIVEGQLHGGVAQGIGGALYEELPYDDDGQPLATSYMDYLLPTSLEVPELLINHIETPALNNPFGIKGIGESGVIPPPAAIANAIEDALRPFNVRINRTPLSQQEVWRLIHATNSS